VIDLQAILVFYSATTIEINQHPTLDKCKSTKRKTNLSKQRGEGQNQIFGMWTHSPRFNSGQRLG